MPQQPAVEWDVFQSLGRIPENLNGDLAVPAKTWVAAAIHKTSRQIIAQSDPQATQQEARADGEKKLADWKRKNRAA